VKRKAKKRLPTLSGTRRMGYQVNLNPGEVEVIDTAAVKAGQTRAAFMRQAALEKAGRS